MARSRGQDAATLARGVGGGVLCHVLLLLADALLSGAEPSGDRTPTPAEIELCRFWRDWELRLLRPELVLVVGGLAARHVLGLVRLTEAVGSSTTLDGAIAFPLPHPSGASGWLNDRANRLRLERALVAVRKSVAALGPSTV